MKKYLFIATALAALAGCSDDTFVGDKGLQEANGSGAISFGFDVPATTRAGGSDAATALSNQFIVYGEKDETSDGAAPAAGKLVFQNYKVAYGDNTAYTTTSNTKDWEYVGLAWTSDEQSHITTSTTDVQTIKYWDYGAASYTFTAVSALPADISSGRVSVTKTTAKTDGNKVYDKGYTITLAKSGTAESYTYPTLNKLYFADRKVIAKGTGSDREAVNAYGGNVTLTFRNLVSQIRAGVYETISGYAVTSIKFYVNTSGESPTQTEEAKVSSTSAFGAVCPNTKATNYEGTITVVYYSNTDGTAIENQPKVTASGTPETNLILGTNMSTISSGGTPLGTSSTSPTWDTSGGLFTEVLPQIGNTTNLKLKVDYTLWNSVSGETINVTGATAEVPAQYLAWKPNYKYTYLFKISDNTNGQTGTGSTPAGLWPITFDAIVVETSDGQAEYITTVSEPSITTFGVKSSKYTTGKDEYETGTDIYATIVASNAVVDPSDKYFVYTATTSDETKPVTEASVAEAIAEKVIRNVTPVITCTSYTTNVSLTATVPAEDGTTITLASSGKAIKLQNVSATGNYVVAYKATAGSASATTEAYDASKTYYSTTADATTGFYPVTTVDAGDLNEGAWKTDDAKAQYTTAPTQPVYVYKVIKVVASGS